MMCAPSREDKSSNMVAVQALENKNLESGRCASLLLLSHSFQRQASQWQAPKCTEMPLLGRLHSESVPAGRSWMLTYGTGVPWVPGDDLTVQVHRITCLRQLTSFARLA